VLEVTACACEPDEQVSLEVYNAVWPHEALTMDEVRSFQASVRDHVTYLAHRDGAAAGSAVGVILPQRADRVFTIMTVLAGQRRRGAGSALYEAISAWAAGRGLSELEVAVLDDDPESLAFAQRRGFVQERRELGLVLPLAEIAPPGVEPPDSRQLKQRCPDGADLVGAASTGELTASQQGRMNSRCPCGPGHALGAASHLAPFSHITR